MSAQLQLLAPPPRIVGLCRNGHVLAEVGTYGPGRCRACNLNASATYKASARAALSALRAQLRSRPAGPAPVERVPRKHEGEMLRIDAEAWLSRPMPRRIKTLREFWLGARLRQWDGGQQRIVRFK